MLDCLILFRKQGLVCLIVPGRVVSGLVPEQYFKRVFFYTYCKRVAKVQASQSDASELVIWDGVRSHYILVVSEFQFSCQDGFFVNQLYFVICD